MKTFALTKSFLSERTKLMAKRKIEENHEQPFPITIIKICGEGNY